MFHLAFFNDPVAFRLDVEESCFDVLDDLSGATNHVLPSDLERHSACKQLYPTKMVAFRLGP